MDTLIDHYLANETSHSERPVAMNALRASGFEAFQSLGLPSRKDEAWKFTSLRGLQESHFTYTAAVTVVTNVGLPEGLDEDDINIVFTNGVLDLQRSNLRELPSGLQILPLRQAFAEQAEVVMELIKLRASADVNGLSALNQAFLNEGVFINVEKNSRIAQHIHIYYGDSDDSAATAAFPRILVSMGERAELSLLESSIGTTAHCLINAVSNIHLQKGARLHHYKIQAASANAVHFDQTAILQERDSFYESFCLGLGGKLARTTLQIGLVGSGAEVSLNGAYVTRGSQQIDQCVVVSHEAENCLSSQFYKGILDDQSRAVFNGMVLVRKGAQKTIARQKNSNLMLSSEAEIDTLPQLEIDADDIKCTHGATIGQLRDDELFYMQARGIRREDAKLLLGRAFIEEAVMKISDIKIQGRVMKSIAHALPKVK